MSSARGGSLPAKKASLVLFSLSILFLVSSLIPSVVYCFEPSGKELEYPSVKKVIDGDTIVISGGEHVRYVGIDAPEKDEPFYGEAKARNKALLSGKRVKIIICTAEPRDRHGRLLGFVYSDGAFVNGLLVKEGLARKLLIPPCGSEKASELEEAEDSARAMGLGIWGEAKDKGAPLISDSEALRHLGEYARVKGRVKKVFKSKEIAFLDFDSGFSAVIFKETFGVLKKDPSYYAGKTAVVSGVIKDRKGRPEIVIKTPSQIEEARP